MPESKKHYDNIDCLRALSFLGILCMHVQVNSHYAITGVFYETVIPSWTWLVYLFLIISSFSMCCGYYEPVRSGTITPERFYSRRFRKILPFYALLVLFAVAVEHTPAGTAEGILELTMAFGLLPNLYLEVMGISWTLGVIFLFYMLFPYFVFLIGNKKRAWFSFLVSLLIQQLCSLYFFTDRFVTENFIPRTSFLYCTPLFFAGGLLYLYRQPLEALIRRKRPLFASLCLAAGVLWYVLPNSLGRFRILDLKTLVLFALILGYAISVPSRWMGCRFFRFLGGISMELYLSHMIGFRILEKLGIPGLLGNGWASYLLTCLSDVALLAAGIPVCRRLLAWAENRLHAGN